MSWGLVAVGTATLVSGYMGSKAAKDAAGAQAAAAKAGGEVQLQMFYEGQEATAPWRSAGGEALSALGDIYGIRTLNTAYDQDRATQYAESQFRESEGAPSAGDIPFDGGGILSKAARFAERSQDAEYNARVTEAGQSGIGQDYIDNETGEVVSQYNEPDHQRALDRFQTSPGYEFQLAEANKAAENMMSASGKSGGARMKRLQEIAQGTANMEFGRYTQGLQSLAGIGQSSAGQTASLGAQVGGNVAGSYMAAGAAEAQGTIGQANAYSNVISQGAQLFGMQQGGYFNQPTPQLPGGGAYGLPPGSAAASPQQYNTTTATGPIAVA